MCTIVETWMPLRQFEKEYPDYQHRYFLKVNEQIVFYEIVSHTQEKREQHLLYFSLEDAYSIIEQTNR